MGTLHRTQVLLEDWHYKYLKGVAERSDRSLSETLRGILSEHITKEHGAGKNRLGEIAGIGADEEASGRDHDNWLYRKG